MELLAKQLPEYRLYHSQKANKIVHYIGIPAVILGFLIALSWISISVAIRWHISFTWIAVIALLVYYYFLNGKVGCGDDGHYGAYHLLFSTGLLFLHTYDLYHSLFDFIYWRSSASSYWSQF
ncbi:Mpo1-like protein [Coxiella-like endosymbiont of Rhipicephalus sanguineus]|uniref:Mpo1-like protein n=1 Tax=Coxiella-like endosymbiont of Rhipicephalus sanguineus TaxID=1955402 RepID=UPI00203C22B7|nr:Mpo1-like protein [Coxiella-like endosymbiont of Rhipicephalus sanguineus]